MGRIINTSSTNTRHKHKYKTSEHNNNNNNNNNNKATSSKAKQIQIYHEDYWIDCIYHVASYGFSTFWSVSSPDGQPSVAPVEEIEYPVSDGLSTGIGLRQDVVTTRGRKLALIPLADIADIGLGVQ